MPRSFRWLLLATLALPLAPPISSQNSKTSTISEIRNSTRDTTTGTIAPTSSAGADASTLQYGEQLIAQHSYQAAIEALKQMKAPTAQSFDRLGVAYESLLDSEDAIRSYKKSLEIDPANPRTLNDLATALDQAQRHREAERLYRKAIKLAPAIALYYKNLGTNLAAQREFPKSAEAYKHALSLDPHIFDHRANPLMVLPHTENAEMNYTRARSCAQAGLEDCALLYLQKALYEGSATPQRVAADQQFGAMKSDPRLQQLLNQQ